MQSGSSPASKLGDTVPQASTAAPGAAPTAGTSTAAATSPASTTPAAASQSAPLGATAPASATSGIAAADSGAAQTNEPPLHVATDVLDIAINLKGGELDRADLLQYPVHKDTPNVPVRLLNDGGEDALYLLQTGLLGGAGEASPTHLAQWTSAQTSYTLAPGAEELRVPLTWTDGQGLKVTKTFTFKRGSYAVDLTYDVQNNGSTPRSLAAYSQFLRHWVKASRSYFDVETYSFKGPAIFDGTKAEHLNADNETDSKFSQTVTGGWLATLQHHFVSAIVPQAGQPYKFQLQVQGQQYLLSATGPMVQVPAGAKAQFSEKLFIGPNFRRSSRPRGRAWI